MNKNNQKIILNNLLYKYKKYKYNIKKLPHL